MYETPDERTALAALLAASRARATAHLQEIVSDAAVPDVEEVLGELTGMRVLALSTVTAGGEPRVSAVDGHFIHGEWTFGTAGSSAKATHVARRPAVSAAYIDGERLGVFVHGRVVSLDADTADVRDPIIAHWTTHYGSDPRTWGDDIRMFRIVPSWMVVYRGATGG